MEGAREDGRQASMHRSGKHIHLRIYCCCCCCCCCCLVSSLLHAHLPSLFCTRIFPLSSARASSLSLSPLQRSRSHSFARAPAPASSSSSSKLLPLLLRIPFQRSSCRVNAVAVESSSAAPNFTIEPPPPSPPLQNRCIPASSPFYSSLAHILQRERDVSSLLLLSPHTNQRPETTHHTYTYIPHTTYHIHTPTHPHTHTPTHPHTYIIHPHSLHCKLCTDLLSLPLQQQNSPRCHPSSEFK